MTLLTDFHLPGLGCSSLDVSSCHRSAVQEASAQDTTFTFKQKQSNECNGFAGCRNSVTITFGGPLLLAI